MPFWRYLVKFEGYDEETAKEIQEETKLIDLLVNNSIASSRREAREFLKANAITLDGNIANDENLIIDLTKKYHTIRRGKKKYYLIKTK